MNLHTPLSHAGMMLSTFARPPSPIRSGFLFFIMAALSPVVGYASNQEVAGHEGEMVFQKYYDVTFSFDIKRYIGKEAKLWVPIPQSTSYQSITNLAFKGNYDNVTVGKDNEYAAPVLFATWSSEAKTRQLEVSFTVGTNDYRTVDLEAAKSASSKNLPMPADMKIFLEPSLRLPTDGIVKELAMSIVGDEQDTYTKAKKIYDWTVTHVTRDESVIGCGKGDVLYMIKNKNYKGKCMDASALYTVLTRAVGVPSREVYGVRVGHSLLSKKAFGTKPPKSMGGMSFAMAPGEEVSDISESQHCRSEFYVPGFGWVPVDAGDVTKFVSKEEKPLDDPATANVREKFFGGWEMNWLSFNHARDFNLKPATSQKPHDVLGYPYVEIEGEALDYYRPAEFGYQFISTKKEASNL